MIIFLCLLGRVYNVTVEEGRKAIELGISQQQCIMQITSSSVLLVLGPRPTISWPFNCIRRYKCHPGIFLLEVGRKAPTGEGEFRFITHEGQEMFEVLGKAVASRISSKRGNNYQTDFAPTNPLIVSNSSQALDIQPHKDNIRAPYSSQKNQTDGNFFLHQSGPAENVRFVMKKRSTSSPPPSPPLQSAALCPSPQNEEIDGYSHLKLQTDKQRSSSNENDYDLLARAKECSRFNQARKSDSRHPINSSSQASKVLGLARSISVDSHPHVTTSTSSTESEDYSCLEFGHKEVEKSQSSDAVIRELNITANVKNHLNNLGKISDNDSVFQEGNVYNKLHEDMPKESRPIGEVSSSKNVTEGTYDRLESNPHIHRQRSRPEPIIITGDAYDALNFSTDNLKLDARSQQPNLNTYDAIWKPTKTTNASALDLHDATEVGDLKKNFGPKVLAPKPAPFQAVNPAPVVAAKPLVPRRPAPAKPPLKPRTSNNAGVTCANNSKIAQRLVNNNFSKTETDQVSNNDKHSFVAKLKKNLEGQGFAPSPLAAKGPPVSGKKNIEPFYAVSHFENDSGSKKQQTGSSDYDVPGKVVVQPAEHKSIDFMYAVSPFHSGNKNETEKPLEDKLYDTPAQHLYSSGEQSLNRNPLQDANNENNTESVYDTPIAQQNEYDVIRNGRPAFSSDVSDSSIVYSNTMQPYPSHSPKSPKSAMQFMYAVSPFVAGRGQERQAGNETASYDAVGGVIADSYEEAGYCEVGNYVRGPPEGYAEVGETFNPNGYQGESIYSVPRGDPRDDHQI